MPEYGGMATPNSKIFLLCNKGELCHKPGLLIAISSGNGGSYPISELRSSSYKNTHIMWIQKILLIEMLNSFYLEIILIPNWLDARIKYSCNLLTKYAFYLKPIQKMINRKDFGNGM